MILGIEFKTCRLLFLHKIVRGVCRIGVVSLLNHRCKGSTAPLSGMNPLPSPLQLISTHVRNICNTQNNPLQKEHVECLNVYKRNLIYSNNVNIFIFVSSTGPFFKVSVP